MQQTAQIGIRVVYDDLPIAGQRDGIARTADRAWELDRAVFVGIFQPRVNDDGRRAAIEALFQIFFADAGNGHDVYCDRPMRRLSNRASREGGRSDGESRRAALSRWGPSAR